MMPTMPISDQLFARAQKLAIPLVEDFEKLIHRAFDALETMDADEQSTDRQVKSEEAKLYEPKWPPVLTWTQPVDVTIDGERLGRNMLYWNSVMHLLLNKAVEAGHKGEALLKLMVVPAVAGAKIDQGYVFHSQADISIQGQDSIGAWKQICAFAEALGTKVDLTFRWQHTPKAAHPGEKGRFMVNC